jgi:trans-aconitate methyltransferase
LSQQTWDPERYARHGRFVTDLGMPVVELLAPQPAERILDLGCGDGALTEKLVALGCRVVGVDGSPQQIAAARQRGLEAYVMDGQRLSFANAFDAVFSNAALHWMPRIDDVLAGVWRALTPGGRFVAECGGVGCVARVVTALVAALARRGLDGERANPWYFRTPEEYRRPLQAQGFVLSFMTLFPRPTPLPGDITGWLETFAESFIARVAVEERATFLAEVREMLRPALCGADGHWTADYVRLRFAATKPRA